ncbi:6-bladed beta-propeller [Polaribacter cellanae]|uniref:6-bladed beta-propeller n=1 Tax=Polaribacter cellanae TaxID=2818493 RepID=A0A975H6S4_9FLAO|nr:6-bladed beta-propeller [Polaribacter cellanae]QTE22229.1 6-bladed beta-propeller [Polaribacter cellanae]
MKKIIFLIIVVPFIFSCKRDGKNNVYELKHIKLNVQKKYPAGNFGDYFSSSKIIALETNNSSFISNIDRITVSNNKILILDTKLNSVLIFDLNGKFINKIQHIGSGPGEYTNLRDFSVDEDKKNIILYSSSPSRILTYEMDGTFLKKENINNFCFNIGYKDSNLLCLLKDKNGGKLFLSKNLKENTDEEFISMNKKDNFFLNLGFNRPSIIKSKDINITFPYSETVFSYTGKEVRPKYYIDFLDNKTPESIVDNLDENYTGLYKYITKNNYGFGISNFRENKNYITFNFYHANLVIHSKKNNTTKIFRGIKNEGFIFEKYFAHDGEDNKIISILPSSNFKFQTSIYKSEKESWEKIPDYIKKIDKNVSNNSNPLLILYTFKN